MENDVKTMLYFAYGSNLDGRQMSWRCPSAEVVGAAWLPDHRLAFAGHSRLWGGAVATVAPAPGAAVEGLVYRISGADLAALDRCEGHPAFYRRVRRAVLDERGRRLRPSLYLLADRPEALPAFPYLATLWRAYDRLGFDPTALAGAIGGAA